MGRGAVGNGGAPDSTLAKASSVLGSAGGLSLTVGGGERGVFKLRACMRQGSREVRAVSERVAWDEPSLSCGFWQVSSPLFNSKSMTDLSRQRDWGSSP